MTAPAFLADLQQRGLSLAATDGGLRVVGPKGLLTEELRAQLVALKPDLLAYLSRPQALADTAAAPVNVNRAESGVPAPPPAADVPNDKLPVAGAVAAKRTHSAAGSRRYAYLSAWLRSVYLAEGDGVAGFSDLPDEEGAECRLRAQTWLEGADDTTSTEELAVWSGGTVAQLRSLASILQNGKEKPDTDPEAAPLPIRITRWSPETQLHVDWFLDWHGTDEPFPLGPGIIAANPRQFIETLRADISAGSRGSRSLYGALQANLSQLYQLFGPKQGEN